MSLWARLCCDNFSEILVALAVLRSSCQVFCRMPHSWDLLGVFLTIRLGYVFWGGSSQRSSAIFVTSFQKYILLTRFMAVDADLDNLDDVVFVRFHHCEVALSQTCCAQPASEAWEVLRPLLGVECLRILFGILLWGKFVSFPSQITFQKVLNSRVQKLLKERYNIISLQCY